MDARAWHLKLGDHVSWFELDQIQVLEAKLSAIKNAGQLKSSQSELPTSIPALTCGKYSSLGESIRFICLPPDSGFNRQNVPSNVLS